jgi:putative ABC transport system permease protein
MEMLWADWRFAARSLRRAPLFAVLTTLTLAFGIGPTAAIFSVVYGVLFRPFPFRAPQSVVIVSAEQTFAGRIRGANYSAFELEEWEQRSKAFDSIGMWGGTSFRLATESGTRPIAAAYVSERFFSTVDPPMAGGRPLLAADAHLPVVVISHRLWFREYGGNPDVIGQTVVLNERPYSIVGVTVADFRFPYNAVDVWTPLRFAQTLNDEPWINNRRGGGFHLVARLRPGVSLDAARQDATRVSATPERWPVLFTVIDWFTDTARPILLMLFAAVGLVLCIACANVMNLLLARQSARTQEIAVRRALGASRARLASYSVAETLIVALLGGGLGLLFAVWSVRTFVALWPDSWPRAEAIRVDGRVFVFALALSVASAVVCALAPLVRTVTDTVSPGMRPTVSTTHQRRMTRSVLVIAQLAGAVVLLVGASLLGRSLVGLLRTDVGIRSAHTFVSEMLLGGRQKSNASQQSEAADQILARVQRISGVRRAALSTSFPLNGARSRYTLKAVNTGVGPARDYDVDGISVTPNYFAVLGVPLLKGRAFSDGDTETSGPVMIMSMRTARRLFGDNDPIGRTLTFPSRINSHEDVTLVGLVGDIKYNGLDAAADGGIYRPYRQLPRLFTYLTIDTPAEPAALGGAIRRAIAEIDPQITFGDLRSIDDVMSAASAEPRFRTTVLAVFAGLALLVACVGLYGAVAYSVTLRRVEIGIRMALGARPGAIMRMVVAEGLGLAAVGIAIGIGGGLAFARVMRTLLYGVQSTDTFTFVAAPATLLILAAIASFLPARRAASLDPVIVLRAE